MADFITDINLNGNELLNAALMTEAPTGENIQPGVFYYDAGLGTAVFVSEAGVVIPFHDNSVKTITPGTGIVITQNGREVQISSDVDLASAESAGLLSPVQYNLFTGATSVATPETLVYRDGSGSIKLVNLTASGTITATKLTGLEAPVDGSDAVPLDHLNTQLASRDSRINLLARGVGSKASAKVVAPAGTATNGTPVIDGVQLAVGDRVLVESGVNGGIWEIPVGAGAWIRPTDFVSGDITAASIIVNIDQGNTNADSVWMLISDGGVTIDTDNQTWENIFKRVSVTGDDSITVQSTGAGTTQAILNRGFTFPTMTFAGDAVRPQQAVELSYGGTGATDARNSRLNLETTGFFKFAITDTAATSHTIVHNQNVPMEDIESTYTLTITSSTGTILSRRKVTPREVIDKTNPDNQYTVECNALSRFSAPFAGSTARLDVFGIIKPTAAPLV